MYVKPLYVCKVTAWIVINVDIHIPLKVHTVLHPPPVIRQGVDSNPAQVAKDFLTGREQLLSSLNKGMGGCERS